MSKDIDTILTEKEQLYFYKTLWNTVKEKFAESDDKMGLILSEWLTDFENDVLKKLEDIKLK